MPGVINSSSVQFSTLHIKALAHSLDSVSQKVPPGAAFETVPMFIYLAMALSQTVLINFH